MQKYFKLPTLNEPLIFSLFVNENFQKGPFKEYVDKV